MSGSAASLEATVATSVSMLLGFSIDASACAVSVRKPPSQSSRKLSEALNALSVSSGGLPLPGEAPAGPFLAARPPAPLVRRSWQDEQAKSPFADSRTSLNRRSPSARLRGSTAGGGG